MTQRRRTPAKEVIHRKESRWSGNRERVFVNERPALGVASIGGKFYFTGRIKLILAVFAVMVGVFAVVSGPAIADDYAPYNDDY